MPVNSIEDIWAVVCEECKKTVSEFVFDCFFVKLKPVSISGGEFTASCTDEYALGVIEENYLEKLRDAVKAVLGNDFDVKLIYEDDEEKIKKAELFSDGLSFEDFFSFQKRLLKDTFTFSARAAYPFASFPNFSANFSITLRALYQSALISTALPCLGVTTHFPTRTSIHVTWS